MTTKNKTPKSHSSPKTHTADKPTQTDFDEAPIIAKPLVRMMALLYDGMLILAMLFLVGTIGAVIGTLLFMEVGTDSTHAQRLPTWYQHGVMSPLFVLSYQSPDEQQACKNQQEEDIIPVIKDVQHQKKGCC